jgi:hypothetical protein
VKIELIFLALFPQLVSFCLFSPSGWHGVSELICPILGKCCTLLLSHQEDGKEIFLKGFLLII